MSTKQFNLRLECNAVVEIDNDVIKAVDGDWRSVLYNLHTPEEIAEHIGYNLIVNGLRLSSMDGWADQDDSKAQLRGPVEWITDATAIE